MARWRGTSEHQDDHLQEREFSCESPCDFSGTAIVRLGSKPPVCTVYGGKPERTTSRCNETPQRIRFPKSNAPIIMQVISEERSPHRVVILQPRESRIVRAECEEELAFVLFQAHTKHGVDVTLSYVGNWSGPPPVNVSHRSRNAGLVRPCSHAEVDLINEQPGRSYARWLRTRVSFADIAISSFSDRYSNRNKS
ncbi:transmembrane 7 superfamily member 3-like [Tropilaelaps mercedesae]|uniref:Transmembrane 7 superfamily member 3-like n=1 Tax=Tropilaelaps mercedesae TaxID=418985 RepID=A0A1V9XBK3_9ACAR|nr:transmembrane 7 superfamily member 3-like [Tropilaelaps mercedesae]